MNDRNKQAINFSYVFDAWFIVIFLLKFVKYWFVTKNSALTDTWSVETISDKQAHGLCL